MTKKQLIHQKGATFGKKRLLTQSVCTSLELLFEAAVNRVRLSPMGSVEGQSEQDVHFSCNSKFQFHISGGKKKNKKSYLLLFLVAQSERLTSRTAKEIQASTRSTQLAFFMKKELRSCLTARKCQLASTFARVCIIESCLKWLLFVEQLMIQQGRLNKTTLPRQRSLPPFGLHQLWLWWRWTKFNSYPVKVRKWKHHKMLVQFTGQTSRQLSVLCVMSISLQETRVQVEVLQQAGSAG